MKILLVVRRFDPEFPGAIGGVIVSSENLIKSMEMNGVDHIVVNTNKIRYVNQLYALIAILWKIVSNLQKVDHLALNLNDRELIYIAPIATWLGKLFGKSCSLRIFGGNLDSFIDGQGILQKKMFEFAVANVQAVFLQTRRLVAMHDQYRNIHWLPTCRYAMKERRTQKPFGRRYVFLGHIRKEKGVREILAACEELGTKYYVDFYGTLVDIGLEEFNEVNCRFMGMIPNEQVAQVLAEYDVLLLPTYWKGEGYPGVVIEAFSAGLPVIASNIENIAELVENDRNGYLVPVKNVEALVIAMQKIDVNNYADFSYQATISFKRFDCELVYDEYLHKIEHVHLQHGVL